MYSSTAPSRAVSLCATQAPTMVKHFDLTFISTFTPLGHWSFPDCFQGLMQLWAHSTPAAGRLKATEEILLCWFRPFHIYNFIIFNPQRRVKILWLASNSFLLATSTVTMPTPLHMSFFILLVPSQYLGFLRKWSSWVSALVSRAQIPDHNECPWYNQLEVGNRLPTCQVWCQEQGSK